jgi:hypothetical protein
MSETPPTRSVKISDDERGGWSSDRPRRNAGPPRPADISVRCRVMRPTDRMRYSPGSLVVIVSGVPEDRDKFAERVFEERGALLSLDRVRKLLAGRVAEEELEARANELLDAAVLKRLQAGESVVVVAEGIGAEERERFTRPATSLRRPRHLIFLDTAGAQASDEDRLTLNDLRRSLDDGSLGQEGFQTAMRLGGSAVSELKRVVFRPPPQED